MKLESNIIEDFATKAISFSGTKALYNQELPYKAMVDFYNEIKNTILPNAMLRALTELDQIQNKLKDSKGIEADEVVSQFKNLSKSIESFAAQFTDAQKVMAEDSSNELIKAVKNSMNMEHQLISKMDQGVEQAMQKFSIDPNVIVLKGNESQQKDKDQGIKL